MRIRLVGGIKGGHLSHWCFQEYFIFFLSLSPTLFCLVFCNFNLAAKYSCSVLSVTASQSPGLSHCVTKTSYSLYLSLSVSLCFLQSDSLSLFSMCVLRPQRGSNCFLSCDVLVIWKSCLKRSYTVCAYINTYSECGMGTITSKQGLERSLCSL